MCTSANKVGRKLCIYFCLVSNTIDFGGNLGYDPDQDGFLIGDVLAWRRYALYLVPSSFNNVLRSYI